MSRDSPRGIRREGATAPEHFPPRLPDRQLRGHRLPYPSENPGFSKVFERLARSTRLEQCPGALTDRESPNDCGDPSDALGIARTWRKLQIAQPTPQELSNRSGAGASGTSGSGALAADGAFLL